MICYDYQLYIPYFGRSWLIIADVTPLGYFLLFLPPSLVGCVL